MILKILKTREKRRIDRISGGWRRFDSTELINWKEKCTVRRPRYNFTYLNWRNYGLVEGNQRVNDRYNHRRAFPIFKVVLTIFSDLRANRQDLSGHPIKGYSNTRKEWDVTLWPAITLIPKWRKKRKKKDKNNEYRIFRVPLIATITFLIARCWHNGTRNNAMINSFRHISFSLSKR